MVGFFGLFIIILTKNGYQDEKFPTFALAKSLTIFIFNKNEKV